MSRRSCRSRPMKLARRVARVFLGVTIAACTAAVATAQQTAPGAPPGCQNLRTFTTAEDHQHMLAQLGIKALRPGPSGNEAAPNHANTDEALANPFPDYPDPLVLKNGRKVTTADAWWNAATPGDRRGLRARGAGSRAGRGAEGHLDGRRAGAAARRLAACARDTARRARGQRGVPRDHGRDPGGARHAGRRDGARAGHDHVRPRHRVADPARHAGRSRVPASRAPTDDPPPTEQLLAAGGDSCPSTRPASRPTTAPD